jgi:hypothetical protein
MFKLVKILNGRINQPEPIRLPAKAEDTALCFEAGSVLKLAAGKLANCEATDKPAYLCAESAKLAPGDERMICVFPINADMVFEVPCADASALVAGGLYTLSLTASEAGHGIACGVTTTTAGGVARVYDKVDPAGDGKRVRVTIPA